MRFRFLYSLYVFLISSTLFAKSIEGSVKTATKGIQGLLFVIAPVFLAAIGYGYYRGKPDAGDKAERFLIGLTIVAVAVPFVNLVKGWLF